MSTAHDYTADECLDAFVLGERLERNGPQVFRPYQYMGTKLRALDAIVQLASETAPHGGRALDLFTGSSVVAQALAHVGYSVDAFDALTFCASSACAILGMERTDGEKLSGLAAQFSEAVEIAVAETAYREWLIRERDALAD